MGYNYQDVCGSSPAAAEGRPEVWLGGFCGDGDRAQTEKRPYGGCQVKPQIPAACNLITKTLARSVPRKGFWVAVLPFKYTGGSADLTALAEGLTEEIAIGLSASHTFV
jgi:hypothetical protein